MASSIILGSSPEPMDVDSGSQTNQTGPASPASTDIIQAVPQLSDTAPTLDKIPDDVLLQIWTLLDDPVHLARTSKRFAVFSKDAFFRARWFLNRFAPYEAIFQAIARPRLYNKDLLERLMHGGAQLSRHLIQLLHLLHNPSEMTGSKTQWGCRISLRAFLDTMEKGLSLYGPDIPFDSYSRDDQVFKNWFQNVDLLGSAPTTRITELFTTHRFMPLPIVMEGIAHGYGSMKWTAKRTHEAHIIESTICRAPDLGPLLRANGYSTDFESSLWLCRKLFGSPSSAGDLKTKVQKLQEVGLLKVSRNVASNVIMGLRPAVLLNAVPTPTLAASQAYDALILLDKAGLLAFELQPVVEKVIEHLTQGAVDATLIGMFRSLHADFPQIDMSAPLVQTTFIEKELLNWVNRPDDVAYSMHGLGVTRDDVLQVCLRNGCKSKLPIQYAMKHIPKFDLKSFLEELVELILCQPYRGKMLRELDTLPKDKVNFRQILADAVERKAFTHEHVPSQQFARASMYGPGLCSHQSPVSSLLAVDWKRDSYAAGAVRNYNQPLTAASTGPKGLPRFTSFVAPEAQLESTTEASDTVPGSTSNDAGSFVPIQGTDNLGKLDFVRLQDTAEVQPGQQRMTSEKFELRKQAFQNLHGPISQEDEAIARVIVELLGTDSKAADVVMSHSCANGNTLLSNFLIEKGVKLHLEHLKISMKAGSRLPDAVLEHLKAGAPFKASFESENAPDTELHYRGKITDEVKRKSQAIADKGNISRTISVGVDAAGSLRIKEVKAGRTTPVGKVVLNPISRLSGAPWVEEKVEDVAEDGASELTDDEEQDVGAAAAEKEDAAPVFTIGAASGDQGVDMPVTDAPIAQRIKNARRKSAQVSYAEDEDETASEETESEDSESESDGIDDEAPVLVIRFDNAEMPIVMDREQRDARLASIEMWSKHLERLQTIEHELYSVVSIALGEPVPSRLYSNAANSLYNLIQKLSHVIQTLRNAKPVQESHTAIEELQELDAELNESGQTARQLQDLRYFISRRKQGVKLYKYERRQAYRRSLHQVKVRGLGRSKREQRERQLNLPALLDEDSADENFEVEIATLYPASSHGSSSSEESESESDEASESSEETDEAAQPVKRAKTGRGSSTATKRAPIGKSATSKKSSKVQQGKAPASTRKRGRSSNESDEDDSEDSDSESSDDEHAAASSSKAASGSKRKRKSTASTSRAAGPSKSKKPVQKSRKTK